MLSHFNHVQVFVTLWTVAYQAPQSMGILQARILEWVAISFSRGSSQPRDRTRVSHVAGRLFTQTDLCVWTWKKCLLIKWKKKNTHYKLYTNHLIFFVIRKQTKIYPIIIYAYLCTEKMLRTNQSIHSSDYL